MPITLLISLSPRLKVRSCINSAVHFMSCTLFSAVNVEAQAESVFTRDPGSSITFQCRAYGTPLPNIAWSKQDNLLVPTPNKFQVEFRTSADSDGVVSVISVLTVSRLVPGDTGNYNCRAFNNISSASLSMPYSLMVTPIVVDHCSPNLCQNGGQCTSGLKSFECACRDGYTGITCDKEATTPTAPVLTTPPQNLVVSLFGQANFSCVASGYPQPEIQWFKDGHLLSGETSSVLVIGVASLSDRAFYHCSATNSEGATISPLAVLNVQGIYQFTVPVLLPLLIPTSGPFVAGEVPSREVLVAISNLVDGLNNVAAGQDVGDELIVYSLKTLGSATTVSSNE